MPSARLNALAILYLKDKIGNKYSLEYIMEVYLGKLTLDDYCLYSQLLQVLNENKEDNLKEFENNLKYSSEEISNVLDRIQTCLEILS